MDDKANITVGIFSTPFTHAFVEDDNDEIVPTFKSLKRFAEIVSDYGLFRLKLIHPESGQLGKLTETGYHDGVLGLMQEGKADGCFFPLPLDTQKAPGHFSSVLSEDHYYLLSYTSKKGQVESVLSSLSSIGTVPIIIAGLLALIVKMASTKRLDNRTDSLVTTDYDRSWSTLIRQHLPNRVSWYFFVQMIILMIPMFIFNASFNTNAIIRNTEAKIETLRDIIIYDKTPIFLEGLSVYDLFKAEVTRDYRDVHRQAILKGTDQLYELGPIPALKVPMSQMTSMLSGSVLQIALTVTPSSGLLDLNEEIYISEKPFHSSLTALLIHNISAKIKSRSDKLALMVIQSGISKKNEEDIYVDFAMNIGLYQITAFDMYKKDLTQKVIDLDWKPLKWNGFQLILYIFLTSMIFITIIQLIEPLLNQYIAQCNPMN